MPALENAKQEQFAVLVATERLSDRQAYARAYETSLDSATTNAWRLREDEGVVARIRELQQAAAVSGALSLAEKRRFLADLVRQPVGTVLQDSPLLQKIKRTRGKDGEETLELSLPDKLAAIKLDAQLAGELDYGSGGNQVVVNVLSQSSM